ncbi:ATP-binding protein [Marinifilum caeruleilacunae]|uniref:histidine kinase n=1 Tax=Marinifilum caeruleilacunae TaxID=2499076 RepID=A0ABX1WX32_9BACT|nr:ATP-binding protein [Marinifilum caeruleilacunae]NOU60685.1 response regulator [Marinifilum caeruleilacunae]
MIVYLLVGGAWILFSDRIVQSLISDINVLTAVQTYKGWFYVLITGILFYVYLKKDLIKIRKAQKKAKESESLKSAFLQNMSHEIRTPMNGIIGFVELLRNENLSKEQRERYMDIILKCSDQLLGVVNDVLDLSLIETGNVKLEKESIHLNKLMDELYLSYSESMKEGVSLEQITKSEELEIVTDAVKLKQLLDNLLSNAGKFTSKGKIEFGFEKQDNALLFFVKDTGVGIKPEQIDKIFNRFERAEIETTKLIGGAGLGLAICKGIVGEMGGKIWVESEFGRGSDFYFNIPFVAASHQKPEEEKEKNDVLIQDDCLLIAEDEDSNYLYLMEILQDLGIEIWRAKNGKEAVEMYQENDKISMILMDIKMPVVDGYEATRRIREFDSQVPIIAQTAFVLGDEKIQALEAGCTDYIPKPFKREEIYNIIRKHQRNHKD